MNYKKYIFYLLATLINFSNQTEEPDKDVESFEAPIMMLDSLQLTLSSKLLLDIYSPKGQTLKGYLGWLPRRSNTTYTNCTENASSEEICLKYGKNMELTITKDDSDECEEDSMTCHSVQCYHIHWKNHMSSAMDCFLLGEDFWYGGGETISQRWPLQGDSRSWHPVISGDPLHHSHGSVVENLWLSSAGFAIYVEHHAPLFASFNESGSGNLCFSTAKKFPYENIPKSHKPELAYSICTAMTIKEAYKYTARKWFNKPKTVPEEYVFQYPIWSTWARYKRLINESLVLDFAQKIKNSELPASQMEIDDKWESCYGDLEFDLEKFPNPKRMTTQLEDLGFPTTLWVHPFCSPECKSYNIGKEKGFWVKDKEGNPIEVKWWNGMDNAMLDTTNKKAVEWFTDKLIRLKKVYGIASFKFDAGEVQWIQSNFTFDDADANLQPNIYTREYARLASEFGGRVEVRVGYETQDLPVFVRMFDKFSHWDYTNGLQTLIPNAFHLSILGYPFILPDMIGGNNYTPNNGSIPSSELYIRWLEANIFMPALQFSIAPFDYDEEVLKITKKMLDLRENYISYILKTARHCVWSGGPIIRPLWWIAPDDTEVMSIDSQFVVGDTIMVAPVLEKGANKRHIYLPDGKWADGNNRNKVYEGYRWLYDYKAPLSSLPFFIKQS